ncbi:ABC transporter permease [Moorellaceae bacterium AZ2]
MMSKMQSWPKALNGLPLVLVAIAWEAGGSLADTPLVPPLSSVLRALGQMLLQGILVENLAFSLTRVALGFLAGSIVGLSMGILMGWSEWAYRFFSPLFSLLYPIPTLGWMPLLMLWVGLNETLPVTIIFICTFIPVLYNTTTGIKSVDRQYIIAARTLGAPPLMVLRRVVLPMALPQIFTGLRLEAGMAWRTVAVAEMIAIPTGIGALLIKAESLIRVDIIMACLLVIACISLGCEKMFCWLENKFTSGWR